MSRMKKILLVDDVKLLIEAQKKFLASSPVQILTAHDGVEALETARRELPDLIIMDKFMPNMDGLTCCRKLKDDPALAHIPIIMATNAATATDKQEYLSAGCTDVLAKPLDCRLFLEAIKKHIPNIECRTVRVPLNIEMQVLHNGAHYKVVTENLSLNGAFAVTERNIAVNDEVKLTFKLPQKEVPLEIKGRIVWQRKSGIDTGFGVEFMEVLGQGISMLRTLELKTFVTTYISTIIRPGRAMY